MHCTEYEYSETCLIRPLAKGFHIIRKKLRIIEIQDIVLKHQDSNPKNDAMRKISKNIQKITQNPIIIHGCIRISHPEVAESSARLAVSEAAIQH